MVSRRDFLTGLSAAALVAATPGLGFAAGNGGAGGNAGGGGNGGGNAGGGNGNAGGNGKATGKGAEPGGTARATLRVRHGNGFQEVLGGGRYHMTDNRGRTIVNRPATAADLARMRTLTAN